MQDIFLAAVFLSFFMLFYFMLDSTYVRAAKKKYGVQHEGFRLGFLKEAKRNEINKRLERLDWPLNLDADKYVVLKTVLSVFSVIYVYVFKVSLVQAVIFVLGCCFLPDIYLYMKEKDIKSAVQRDLPIIIDMFEAGIAVNVDEGEILFAASQAVKSKYLSKRLQAISAEYFTGRDKDLMRERLKNLLNTPEADMLVMTLEQRDLTGRAREMLSAISQMLYTSNMVKARFRDKMADYKVMIAAFVITVANFALYMGAYMPELMSGLRTIF